MNLKELLQTLETTPESVEFADVIAVIDENYHYTPTTFYNGDTSDTVTNQAGSNEGSCKIFSFAGLHNLSGQSTLHCFGDFYRKDVLTHPDGKDHANIRNFMKYGWKGIRFDSAALVRRN